MTRKTWSTGPIRVLAALVVVLALCIAPAATAADRSPDRGEHGVLFDLAHWFQDSVADLFGGFGIQFTWSASDTTDDPTLDPVKGVGGGGSNGTNGVGGTTDEGPIGDPNG